jgi:hypothetical protein
MFHVLQDDTDDDSPTAEQYVKRLRKKLREIKSLKLKNDSTPQERAKLSQEEELRAWRRSSNV